MSVPETEIAQLCFLASTYVPPGMFPFLIALDFFFSLEMQLPWKCISYYGCNKNTFILAIKLSLTLIFLFLLVHVEEANTAYIYIFFLSKLFDLGLQP